MPLYHKRAIAAFAVFAFLLLAGSPSSIAQDLRAPLRLKAGPHLFIDSYLIADSSFLTRVVGNPKKLPQPVVTGGKNGDANFQPYLSVLRAPKSGRFRMWYNTAENESQSHIGYIESEDGIHWIRPHRVLKDPGTIKFGVTVLDRGDRSEDPQKRYLLAYYYLDGYMIAASADGFDWKLLSPTAVLKHNHDINSLYWDPLRNRFLAVFSVWVTEGYEERRRIPHASVSSDLFQWKKPWPIIVPKVGVPLEQGEMQFYSMCGIQARGGLLIGLVKVLRDDLNATPGKTGKEMGDLDRKAAGLGYTVLAWSRDGETWERDYEPFIPNNPVPGTWDHAMAWGDEQVMVGDETFIYYVGYARGHKVERYDERQIGLARMPRDRYVAREADLNPGRLVTKPLFLEAASMTINANVVGSLRMRLVDANGKPKEGFEWAEIRGDSVAHKVPWKKALHSLGVDPVRIEFELNNGQLFGFDLIN